MNTATNKAIKIYEYRIEATPRYISPIEEEWKLCDVFFKRLENGRRNYAVVFRREIRNTRGEEEEAGIWNKR